MLWERPESERRLIARKVRKARYTSFAAPRTNNFVKAAIAVLNSVRNLGSGILERADVLHREAFLYSKSSRCVTKFSDFDVTDFVTERVQMPEGVFSLEESACVQLDRPLLSWQHRGGGVESLRTRPREPRSTAFLRPSPKRSKSQSVMERHPG